MTEDQPDILDAHQIRNVTVVGCGTIGASWASLFLSKGLNVTATDVDPAAEGRLRAFVETAWPALETLGLSADASLERLRFEGNLARACVDGDFVQENGPEREGPKMALLAEIDANTRPSVVIASSTSALQVSRLQEQCRFPGRIVLGHPFNPPHLVPLVEVGGGVGTTEQAIEQATNFYRMVGKTTIRLKREIEGHIANRLQAAVFREAMYLLDEGIADLTDIDAALTEGPGLRWALMGPFLTFHLAGGPGGIRSFFEQFMPMQISLWEKLGTPQLDEPTKMRVIQAVDAEISKLDQSALVKWRDNSIVSLLQAKLALGRPD